MANQSVQPMQLKSTPASSLYAYNPVVPSGTRFATVSVAHKKEKASLSSIFSWKKDKARTTLAEQQQQLPPPPPPTLYGPAFHQPSAYPAVVQYAPNYVMDSNQKFMHYNHPSIYKPDAGYLPYPSTIHATIRYLPNQKQRTNILATNWEPAAVTYPNATYPHPSVGQQPITLQHEITYSEQITIAPSACHHHCQSACLAQSKNQNACKCYATANENYFLVPNSSLLESSTKLHNRSTDCMALAGKRSLQSKHSSIRGSKSHHDLALDDAKLGGKKKGGTTKFAATVNERFLRIFKKSIKEPFNTVKSRKSILDCDLTAYDLVEAESAKENGDEATATKRPPQPANLDSSLEEEQPDDANRFESNFIQAKAKQKQHYYAPFKERRQAEPAPSCAATAKQDTNSLNYNSDKYLNNNKNSNRKDKTTKTNNNDEEDRWSNAYPQALGSQASTASSVSAATSKFNSCRIAGQGMKFSKRISILESDLSKEFLREELSEDEDLNRFDRYAQNFTELSDKRERRTNCDKSNKSNRFNGDLNNFRLLSSAGSQTNSSIPNLPDPDYDTAGEDEETDRHTLTALSRSTPDLEQTTSGQFAENEQRQRPTLTNTTSLFNLDSPSLKAGRPCLPPPLPPLPKARSQQLNSAPKNSPPTSMQSSSPSSSTYSSINSNVKSILKKSNPNLVLLEHLKAADLLDRKRKEVQQIAFRSGDVADDCLLSKRCLSTKSVSTFKSTSAACNYQQQQQQQQKKLEDYKPKKQVHFTRSSFNDELIVEHIGNQELIEEEGIYDDILTARLKPSNDGGNEPGSEPSKENNKNDPTKEDDRPSVGKEEDDNAFESKSFLKLSDSKRAFLNQSPESPATKSPDSDEQHFDTPLADSRVASTGGFLSTGKLNAIKERPSFWTNQSSQLPKGNSNFEFKRDNNTSEFDRYYFANSKLRNGDELQSTALIKQNRKQVADSTSSSNLLRQMMHSSERRPNAPQPQSRTKQSEQNTADKSLDLLQSLTQSTDLSSNLSSLTQSNTKSPAAQSPSGTASNGFKEDNSCLFDRPDNDDQQQMSPSSSSSTSAYVSLYASSSFSSAGSSSSNYSTSGFNSNNENGKEPHSLSDSSSKKISRSAILDSLINRKHGKLPDKPFDKSGPLKSAPAKDEQTKQIDSKQESKANKIVIDVSMNESNNYDSLNQSTQNEHIYEELEGCRFEKEINIIDNLNNNLNTVKKSIFEGASKDQIIEYLVDAKERIQELLINNYNDQYSSHNKFSSLSTSCYNIASNRTNRRNRVSNLSNVSSDSSSSSDILLTNSMMSSSIGQHLERNDSGVGTETSKPSLDIRISKSEACLNELIDNHIVHLDFDPLEDDHEEETLLARNKANQSTTNDSGADEQTCVDCEQNICAEVNEKTGLVYYPLLCTECDKRRAERKEIIAEFVDTEFKYGRDLRIMRDEFYRPLEKALLTKDQLKSVFLNLDELIEVNSNFSEKLQDAIDIATEQGDEDYTTVDIGHLFMESCDMLKSFETYCIKQSSASRTLSCLEKEKELLKVFLRVSQIDNPLLRRMNLSAFLMVPVQRVTKYPLLLNRLFKVTPYHHSDRPRLKEAQLKAAMHLEHINQQTKGTVPNKIWRRISNLSNNSTSKRSHLEELGDVKLKKFNSSVRDLFKSAFKSRS